MRLLPYLSFFNALLKRHLLLEKKPLILSTNTVINANNFNSLDTIISMAKTLGFTAEFSLPYEQALGNKDNPALLLDDQNIKMVLKTLIRHKDAGAPISFSNASRRYALKWPLSYNQKIIYDNLPVSFKFVTCYMGRFMCLIDSDGLVYPCGQLIGNFPAQDIRIVGFKKAWESLLENRRCKACYSICFTEFNQFFALKPSVLLSAALRSCNRPLRCYGK